MIGARGGAESHGEGKENRGWEEGKSSSLDSSPIITASRNNTINLCKCVQERKPFSRRGNGPEVPRCSSGGSFYPWSCVDTHPSAMGEDMEFHLWEPRANRGSLAPKDPQHMSDATYTTIHRRQDPPAMEIQKLPCDSVQGMSHTTKRELL